MKRIFIPMVTALLFGLGLIPAPVAIPGDYASVAQAAQCGGGASLQSDLSSIARQLLPEGATDAGGPAVSAPSAVPGTGMHSAYVRRSSPPAKPARRGVAPTQRVRHAKAAAGSSVGAGRESTHGHAQASPPHKVHESAIYWKDAMKLRYVPGGKVITSGDSHTTPRRSAVVNAFYMDETPVTNLQYVNFLNAVLPKLKVDHGVVRSKGRIWLLLGEVKQGYRPIEFRNGEFIVSNSEHAACPVLRVSAYGAAAYAAFYGKRLPTERQWLRAVQTAGGKPQKLPIPSPVMLYHRDSLGIRGLSSDMREWTVRRTAFAHAKHNQSSIAYFIMRASSAQASQKSGLQASVQRYPWEAFADVGFRCVLPAPENNS